MFLVVIVIDTPGCHVDPVQLHQRLSDSAAGSGRLEHAYLETRPGAVALSLYLRASCESTAMDIADELSSRTMTALPEVRRWRIARRHQLD